MFLPSCAQTTVDSEERIAALRDLAAEAYVFFYPVLQNYRTHFMRSVDQQRPFNTMSHRSQRLDASFTTIVAPNNDTLYSAASLDLRQEPVVLHVPKVPPGRYYSVQMIDLFSHNFSYIGQRTFGGEGGRFLIAGPRYQGQQTVVSSDRVITAESELVFLIVRILAEPDEDIDGVIALQRQFDVEPLSRATGEARAPAPSPIAFPRAYRGQFASAEAFVEIVNAMLPLIEVHPSERDKVERYSVLGFGRDQQLDSLSPRERSAVEQGVADAIEDIQARSSRIGEMRAGWSSVSAGFGSRTRLQGKYLARAAASMVALYGHDREENNAFSRHSDDRGEPLDGGRLAYEVHFPVGELPPVDAFWSLTAYRLPQMFFYDNPIDRYSIGDRTRGLRFNEDGSLTLYLQHAPPAPDKLANWLPVPAGKFALALRCYLPQPQIYEGSWAPPGLKAVPLATVGR